MVSCLPIMRRTSTKTQLAAGRLFPAEIAGGVESEPNNNTVQHNTRNVENFSMASKDTRIIRGPFRGQSMTPSLVTDALKLIFVKMR